MSESDYSEETRAVYHKQHIRIAEDKRAMQRFIGMFSTDYFGLGDDYFKGKRILEAGCGNTAKVMIALNRFGAADLHGIETGDEFFPVAKSSLEEYDVSLESVTLKSASLLDIPYENNYFDFVVCHGALLHLNNLSEVETAFSELVRVTKPEGHLYTVYCTIGGLFEDAIFPAIRKYYRENDVFKRFMDNVSPEDFHNIIDLIMKGLEKYDGEKINLSALKNLFDVDFSVFLQNFTQAPVRLSISEEFIRKLYSDNGLNNVRRLRRYVKRKNIRKFFAPLHYEVDHPVSKMLYGCGSLEFIGTIK